MTCPECPFCIEMILVNEEFSQDGSKLSETWECPVCGHTVEIP